GQPRAFHPWSPEERQAFGWFNTPNALAMGLSSADSVTRSRAEQVMRKMFHVRSSYTDWFIDERYLRSRMNDILFVGRQESLSEDFRRLKRLVGLPDAAELPADDV